MSAERIMTGMSGGVDSSVCAALLLKAGYEVAGVTLRLYDGEDYDAGLTKTCCSLSDAEDAKAVCVKLGIPHYVFNFKEAFRQSVIDNFIGEYISGRTPNPCIECNRKIKFEAMLDRAKTLGYDKIATGHYAVVEQAENGRYLLKKAADSSKDQTYVLCKLTQHQLSHTLFPLGDIENKDAVRALAAEAVAIRERLPKGGAVIALCIEGKPCSSVELSRRMEELAVAGKTQLTFLIGGSVGLDESLKRQADWRLSMSPMTFPHHLARIMLLEQIYRAYQISAGTKYHK